LTGSVTLHTWYTGDAKVLKHYVILTLKYIRAIMFSPINFYRHRQGGRKEMRIRAYLGSDVPSANPIPGYQGKELKYIDCFRLLNIFPRRQRQFWCRVTYDQILTLALNAESGTDEHQVLSESRINVFFSVAGLWKVTVTYNFWSGWTIEVTDTCAAQTN